MHQTSVRCLFLLCLLLLLFPQISQSSDDCNKLLEHGIRDTTSSDLQEAQVASLKQDLCDETNSLKSSIKNDIEKYKESIGAGASFMGFGGSFNFNKEHYNQSERSDLETYAKKFCSSASVYSSKDLKTMQRASILNGKAIDAWLACTQSSISIHPYFSPNGKNLDINFMQRQSGNNFLQYIDVEKDKNGDELWDCVISSNKLRATPVGSDIFPIEIDNNAVSMTCQRKIFDLPNGEKYAPVSHISIHTSAKIVPLDFDRYYEPKLPYSSLKDLGIKVDGLEKSIEARDRQIQILKTQISDLQGKSDGIVNGVQTLQNDIAVRPKIRWKLHNNGTVSCQQYCNGGWEGFSGECVTAIIGANTLNSCTAVPGGATHCLCAPRP